MEAIKNVMRGNLLVFTIGDVIRQLSMFITFPFFSLYVVALGGTNVDIGIVNSLRPLLGLIFYPIAGYLSDHYSRVKIIFYSSFLSAILWLFFLFATDWKMLAFGNLLMGLNTFYFPASNSLLADSLPQEKRGLGYSLWSAIPGTIGIISPFIGGFLTTYWGVIPAMRFLYTITLILGLVIAIMNLKFLEETVRLKDNNFGERGLKRLLVDAYKEIFEVVSWLPRNLKAFAVLLGLSFFINNISASYWVVYTVEELGITKIQWGTILLISTIINVLLLLPAGSIVDKFGAQKLITISMISLILPVLLFPFSRSFWDVLVLIIIGTIFNSFLISGAPAYMAQAVPPSRRGRVMSALGQGMLLINIRGGLGGGPGMGALLTIPSILGSLLGGFIYDFNPVLTWFLMGFSFLISGIVGYFFLK